VVVSAVVSAMAVVLVEVNRPNQQGPAAIVRSQPCPVTVSRRRIGIVRADGLRAAASEASQQDHRREESESTHGLKVVGRPNGDKIILRVVPIT
jgi:hypothetical protein